MDKTAFYAFIERQTEGHFEFVRGRIVQQMTGRTRDHGLVARRVANIIEQQLDGSLWTVFQERGVETEVTVRYPEVVVEPADEPGKSLSTLRPRVIVEVLSRPSIITDLEEKPVEYMGLDTLDAYIVASQDEATCLVWQRGADGTFASEPFEISGHGAVLYLTFAGALITIPLADVYRGIA
jgi:Uma2 family endonuclease